MNILVVGSGGREHALVWALKKSPSVKKLWALPGNLGMLDLAERVSLNPVDVPAVVRFAVQKKADLVVIGPEAPLAAGLADALRAEGIAAFGPGAAAAKLESSKVFAKDFMSRHGLPTAEHRSFDDPQKARDFLHSPEGAAFRVVKADGLAAGKGVVVCDSLEDTLKAVADFMVARVHGAAGATVVLEETLAGPEATVMALCDGKTILPLLPTRDHKRLLDGDQGPNTGGMGAVAPVEIGPRDWAAIEKMLAAFAKGLAKDKLEYRGTIYFGLMLTPRGPKLLEFNVRFGDPETQAVLPLLQDDLGELLAATAAGRLEGRTLRWAPGASVCVVLASAGYPQSPQTGAPISGLDQLPAGVVAFHAGTDVHRERWRTAGGRVLAVSATGPNLDAARGRAYAGAAAVQFKGCHYRTDIGVAASTKAHEEQRAETSRRKTHA